MTINIQQVIENKIDLEEARSMVIMHNNEAFTFFDEGCTRYVYKNASETLVIKIDKTRGSNMWNQKEIEIYQNATEENKKQMTPTRMVGNVIEQDFCEPIQYAGIKLSMDQIRFAQSCRGEVGWDKDGNLVCFDLDEFKKY